jgi:hypothetical protein
MPKGANGEKRPADVISNAVKVMRIATGEITQTLPLNVKSAAAQELGGKTRAEGLSSKRRREIAKAAAHCGPKKRVDSYVNNPDNQVVVQFVAVMRE